MLIMFALAASAAAPQPGSWTPPDSPVDVEGGGLASKTEHGLPPTGDVEPLPLDRLRSAL
jgi:hypothetical protein